MIMRENKRKEKQERAESKEKKKKSSEAGGRVRNYGVWPLVEVNMWCRENLSQDD